ncbi:hypothetical protein CDIK_0451 [Cucumispora dikerogammari]|nr:hypothetical protein CDIK_0451 [Cucumispora dikerogammari]
MEHFKELRISENSTIKDIKKAYNKLIMKYHPDRKTGNQTIFIEIEAAYIQLIDTKKQEDEKRKRQIEMFSKLEEFKSTYQNSEEEKGDIIKYYKQFKGNISKIIKNLFCAAYSDEERIRKIINDLIEKKLLVEEVHHTKRVSNKRIKKEKKEAEEVEKTLIKDVKGEKTIGFLEDVDIKK